MNISRSGFYKWLKNNGWLKNEMYIDFDINNYSTVQEFIEAIVRDNNEYRPSYALNYKTPIEYRMQLGFP